MPSQKQSFDDLDKQVEEEYEEEDSLSTHQKLLLQDEKDEQDPDAASVESPSSGGDKDTEFVLVKLSEIRKEVQCPICLGIIRKTRTVMECLHRFCRECIDKSMRLGNNECPACRTHCASRRSLRDDPNYDALIAVLYPDIDKYEEEELAFHEEEKVRNEQIQASIAQTSQRQTEALGKRRTRAKATVAAFMRRGSNRNSSRLRGRNRQSGNAGSDEDEEDLNVNEEANDSSSADEPSPKVRRKRQKRWATPRFSPAMGTGTNSDGGCNGTGDIEVCRESTSASPARAGNPEVLVWGKGGTRSHTRHGSLSGSNGRNGRSNRVSKLIDYLRNLDENDDGFDVHVTLLPMDNKIPRLQRPFLCCRPTLSVKHLCQFIALQIHVQEEELEIFVEEPKHSTGDQCGLSLNPYLTSMNEQIPKLEFDDAIKGEPHILEAQETLADLHAAYNSSHGNLVLVYRSKLHELGTAKATTDVGFDFTVMSQIL